jgi:hypothetical protein
MSPLEGNPGRIFYVDDSGAEETGIVSASWIECSAHDWQSVRGKWLDMRRRLYTTCAVPASTELHSTHFVGGRENPSNDPEFNKSKKRRHEAMELILDALSGCAALQVGTIYRRTDKRGSDFNKERIDLFGQLIGHLDTRLNEAGEIGMIYVDGRETPPHRKEFRSRHRNNIIEEPNFCLAERVQLLQAADVVAWTSYQSILRHPNKEVIANWYDTYLRGRDVHNGPMLM